MAAEGGLVRAQSAVALFYENGRGTERNLEEAVRWYLNVVDEGVPGASARLGAMIASGLISASGYPNADNWVLDAARSGDAAALNMIQSRAETGDPAAMYALGAMYQTGEGVPQHTQRSVEFMARAARAGSPRAQLAMARRYGAGDGVEQDYVEAHFWSNLAASRGVEGAARERDVFARFLSPEQLAEAQNRAADWQPETRGG
jgi:hypothetical protein